VSQIYQGNRFFDVSVILEARDRRDPESVKNLMIRNTGEVVMPLNQLSSVRLAAGPYAILYDSAHRVQVVTCNVESRDLTSFAAEAERKLRSGVALSQGVYVEFAAPLKPARNRNTRFC
jgi:cobalt-zinc-cadmium resistance protein CzcA